MQVRHTHRARADLLDIWLGIAADDPGAADRVYDRLEARVRILESFAEAGRTRHDIDPAARMLVEYPYVILYRLVPDGPEMESAADDCKAGRQDRTNEFKHQFLLLVCD